MTTDPNAPAEEVSIRWRSRGRLLSDVDVLDMGQLRTAEGASRTLPLFADGVTLCTRCEWFVEADSPLIDHAIESEPGTRSMAHETIPAGAKPRRVARLLVTVPPRDDAESYRQLLAIRLQCNGDTRARMTLPVRWQVRPRLVVTPARLSLGTPARSERLTRRLVLRSTDGQLFRIEGVDVSAKDALAESRYSERADNVQSLEMDFTTPDETGPWRTTIVIRTDHAEATRIEVPLSAIITEAARRAE
jgi:hypothetical protein